MQDLAGFFLCQNSRRLLGCCLRWHATAPPSRHDHAQLLTACIQEKQPRIKRQARTALGRPASLVTLFHQHPCFRSVHMCQRACASAATAADALELCVHLGLLCRPAAGGLGGNAQQHSWLHRAHPRQLQFDRHPPSSLGHRLHTAADVVSGQQQPDACAASPRQVIPQAPSFPTHLTSHPCMRCPGLLCAIAA